MNHSTPLKVGGSDHRLALLMLIPALGLVSWTALAQKLYRWVDDQGEVHYSDQVPPSQADKERTRLSKQGFAVETQPAVPTGEELKRVKELERQKAEEARRRAERQAEDERLLKLYRTLDELELALDGRLAAVEAVMQVKRDKVRNESERLVDLDKERQALRKAGLPPPDELTAKIQDATARIRADYAEIVANEYRKLAIQEEFKHSIERFRQLRQLPPPTATASSDAPGPSLSDALVVCSDKARCHAYWKRAVDYVRAHSDREGEILEVGLLLAFQNDEREHRTFTLSWTQRAPEQPVHIYLDIQCKNRLTASLVCLDPRVPEVRAGFRSAVMEE